MQCSGTLVMHRALVPSSAAPIRHTPQLPHPFFPGVQKSSNGSHTLPAQPHLGCACSSGTCGGVSTKPLESKSGAGGKMSLAWNVAARNIRGGGGGSGDSDGDDRLCCRVSPSPCGVRNVCLLSSGHASLPVGDHGGMPAHFWLSSIYCWWQAADAALETVHKAHSL